MCNQYVNTSFINTKAPAQVTLLTTYEYTFLPNRELWYAYVVDITDTKLVNI